jgi:uncharacterized protein (TIGR02246 family)
MTNASTLIEAAHLEFQRALRDRDLTAIGRLYTDDARLLPPHAPARTGRAAIVAFWEAVFERNADNVIDTSLRSWDLIVMGDTACEAGQAVVTVRRDGTEIARDEGKYLVVWRCEAAVWRLHLDMFNSDRPLPT